MDEIRPHYPEETHETSETSRDSEAQHLDDATYEPGAIVERCGDYQQAEAIQETLRTVVQNSVAAQDLAGISLSIPQSEQASLMGSLPQVRGDLDQTSTTSGEDPDGDGATPINLPRPQAVGECPEPGPIPYPNLAEGADDSIFGARTDLSNEPSKPIEFEKPILYKDMTEEGTDLSKLADIDSLLPGPGSKILGAPEQPGWSSASKEGKFGSESLLGKRPGFEGGPDSLINAAENSSDPHEPLPGMNSPILPGHGKPGGADVQGKEGGKGSPPAKTPPAPSEQNKNSGPQGKQIYPAFVVTSEPDVKISATFYTPEAVARIEARACSAEDIALLNKIYDNGGNSLTGGIVWDPPGGKGPNKQNDTPDEKGSSGNLASEDAHPSPGFGHDVDPGHISNYPEDHIGGIPPTGNVRPVGAVDDVHKMEKVNTSKKSHKAGAEQITDPPEPMPGKKSETSGKES